MKWIVHFREIKPRDYHTPLSLIPVQKAGVDADTRNEAYEKVRLDLEIDMRDFRRVDAYTPPTDPDAERSEQEETT